MHVIFFFLLAKIGSTGSTYNITDCYNFYFTNINIKYNTLKNIFRSIG